MTDQQFQNFQAFMNRAHLSGAEVPSWVEVVNAVASLRAGETKIREPAPPGGK